MGIYKISLKKVSVNVEQNCHPVATICASSKDCDPAGSCCRWDWNNGVITKCDDATTTYDCGGYNRSGDYCWQN